MSLDAGNNLMQGWVVTTVSRLPVVESHVDVGVQIEWTGDVQHISWKPRVFLYKKFLSDEECDHLINKGAAGLAPSEVRHQPALAAPQLARSELDKGGRIILTAFSTACVAPPLCTVL